MADVALGQIAHDAVGRGQTESAAAGQHHGVDFLVVRLIRGQQSQFAAAGGRAAAIDAAVGAGRAEEDGATGGKLGVCGVAEAHAGKGEHDP